MSTPPPPPEVPKFAILGDWLCVEVDSCNCGTGDTGYGHEQGCRLEQAAPLAHVDALLRTDAARQITAVEETQPGLWRVSYASGDTSQWHDGFITPAQVVVAELQAEHLSAKAREMRTILDHKRSAASS